MDWPILSLVTFLPLVGVVLIAFIPADNPENSRRVALWVSGGTFIVSLLIWFNFDRTTAAMRFVEEAAWMPMAGIAYRVGIDGISMLFVLLTTLLTPLTSLLTLCQWLPVLYLGLYIGLLWLLLLHFVL